MAVLCIFGRAHKLFMSCIRRGFLARDSLVDGDWYLRLSDVGVICRVVNPRPTSQKIWGSFLYGLYIPGE